MVRRNGLPFKPRIGTQKSELRGADLVLFRKDKFVYDPARDIYRCPAGEILKKDGVRYKQRITRYMRSVSSKK